MGANEELTNLLNAPNREDFWISMDVDATYHVDAPWHAVRETMPPFDSSKKTALQHGHFVDVSSPTTPSFSTADQLYAFGDASLNGSDAFGQNFLPDAVLEAVPETNTITEGLPPSAYHRCSSRPLYADVEYDVTASAQPSTGHESESTNSSLETTFQLPENFIAQERTGSLCRISNHQPANIALSTMTSPVISSLFDIKIPESSQLTSTIRNVKMECESLPTMMVRPSHTLPQMTPPILPKLCANGPALSFPSARLLDSTAWESDPVGSVFGRSLAHSSEPKCDDRSSLHKSHSTPTISCISRSQATGCNLFCNTNLGTIVRRPKKPYIGKLTPEERQLKIMRYRQKRNQRKFDRGVTYQCRKTLADRRPRVRGRFARNNDIHATFPKNKTPSVSEEGMDTPQRPSSF